MSMYSLTKFAQIYSSHSCWFFKSVSQNSWDSSLEAPDNANACEPRQMCSPRIHRCSSSRCP